MSKVIFEDTGEISTRFWGSLVEFYPLATALLQLTFIYLFGVAIRSYYLNKYSEQFRQKFDVKEEEWYGEKDKSS
ncbi:hypothetical protein [Pueribacillus sp. YX66]|uniref:hypothetical protein n=1 Tax=Pueribacillus sp. YX66 TaxID=3229242 RepID=UPI00358D7BD5